MTTIEISEYYDATYDSKVRSDLEQAVSLIKGPKTAIDCGCGAGSDTAYLLGQGFTVHAFDIEGESVSRCKDRFKDEKNLFLSQDSFHTFTYPTASLIVADASLFYCSEKDFGDVWSNISQALSSGGIFVGSFLGLRDTTASAQYQRDAFWPDVTCFTETALQTVFENYHIVNWTEHEMDGKTAQGIDHHWHIYAVIARKG